MTGAIRVTRTELKAEIVLDNPSRRNAISATMWKQLRSFAGTAREDVSLRTLIISSEGSVFSAGADVTGFEAGRNGGEARIYDDLVESTLRAIEELPQVVIVGISGPCVGAGASLACACDIRVADTDSFFLVPAARLGLGYDPRGIARFIRIFGACTAQEMLLLATRVASSRAFDLGAVQRLVAPGEANRCAHMLADAASSLAPLTQQAAKFSIRELTTGNDISDTALELTSRADTSLDYAEGRAAFTQKRLPTFRGV